jgi:hypothetical protein
MSLVLSILFWVFAGVLITVCAIIAVYMVLGLELVENLRETDSQYQALQLQTQFLVDGASTSIKPSLEESGAFGVLQSSSKLSFPSGCTMNAAGDGANKQRTTSKVYGVALQ